MVPQTQVLVGFQLCELERIPLPLSLLRSFVTVLDSFLDLESASNCQEKQCV